MESPNNLKTLQAKIDSLPINNRIFLINYIKHNIYIYLSKYIYIYICDKQ